jgi:hypothetical protein
MAEDSGSPPNLQYPIDPQQFHFAPRNDDYHLLYNFKFSEGPFLNHDDNSMLHLDNFNEPMLEPLDNNRPSDELSEYSNNSTNCSSKYSPEYYAQDANGQNNNNEDKKAQVLRLQKKAIHKSYEPLHDGVRMYKYEENPMEYKKARKRLQNRESAARVRYKKKNFAEEAEVQIEDLKKENATLQLKNATLTAENNLLKQQIGFLEKMVMKTNGVNPEEGHSQMRYANNNNNNNPNNSQFILPVAKKGENEDQQYDNPNYNFGVFRTVPQHAFKKHVALLGIVTLVLCIGFISLDTTLHGAQQQFSVTQFKNNIDLAIKSFNTSGSADNTDTSEMQTSLSKLILSNQEYNSLKTFVKYIAFTAYFVYLIYVCLIANWRFILRTKLKKF